MSYKQEEQAFYDTLLTKILALPKVQETIAELRKDYEGEGQTEFEIEVEAICDFIDEGDDKDILAVPEIWRLVQETVRDTIRDFTYNPETFLAELSSLDPEDIFRKKLEEIHEELDHALERKHGRTQQ